MTSESDQLVDVPESRKGLLAVILVVVLALLAGGYFFLFRGNGDAIRIGVVGASDPYWKTFEEAAADQGLDVEIVDFNERGPLLAVRPYTHTDHYWQVYFDTNRVIADTFGAAGYPVPESHVRMKQMA